jgi:hypothetical protein
MKLAKPLLAAVASLTLTACVGAPREVDEQTDTTREAALTTNALTVNALTVNALTVNALTVNALTVNALTVNGLTSNALTVNALHDPNARELLSYIVSCALPADESVTIDVEGTTYTYDGQLGLTPEWGEPNGSCDLGCQEWVSACLLARLDYLGVKREISVRGDNPALQVSAQEAAAFTVREATYYGNIFDAPVPQLRFGCLSPGQTEDVRVCGPTLQGCAVDFDPNVTCADVCGAPRPYGSFPDCKPLDGKGWLSFPYHGSITVYLEPGEP